ncbi:hypothetical protein J2S17_003640 [Cytobacillus purgationiresistens]|uniref:Uncharacterized protein n=2 Tax=Cytobacillus purgationiresistens TaxID=863449 RepID=A0ABU0AKF1_9BACI|nr:hypothetical protein [Cytobacillus purgationiresistens]
MSSSDPIAHRVSFIERTSPSASSGRQDVGHADVATGLGILR